MTEKRYLLITIVVFAIVTAVHLLRIVFDWSVVIAGWSVPLWVSWAGMVFAASLGFIGLKLYRRM